jgi:hypothetical protein
MNKFSSPGFTAESSLYDNSMSYQGAQRINQVTDIVQPVSLTFLPEQPLELCFLDCLEECIETGESETRCRTKCRAKCRGGPPYQCTPRDNSVNRNICLAGIFVWQTAAQTLCSVMLGGLASYGCSWGVSRLADYMRVDCPPATICV